MTELEKLNRFTRREHQAEEVYLFDAVLCDNEIDRDLECFSEEALGALQKLFIGKTGIFDHDLRAGGQTARIYDTEIVRDAERMTKDGRPYMALKAKAYMIRTASNADLIREIDGGIKKEVSISCSAGRRRCSVCGADRSGEGCRHVPGRIYDGKLCCTVLDEIRDAYEWSFVAVPAQVAAGVTKHFTGNREADTMEKEQALLGEVEKMLRKEVLVLCGRENAVSKALCLAADKMDIGELMAFKRALLAEHCGEAEVQLCGNGSIAPEGAFRMD